MCDCDIDVSPIVEELKLHRPIIPAPGWKVIRVHLSTEEEKGFSEYEYSPLGWQVQDCGDYKLVCTTGYASFVADQHNGDDSDGYWYLAPTEDKQPSDKGLLHIAHSALAWFVYNKCRRSSSLKDKVTPYLKEMNITINWKQLDDIHSQFYNLSAEVLIELEDRVTE
jgi:hypothetical protein